jgi:hypothetical protein
VTDRPQNHGLVTQTLVRNAGIALSSPGSLNLTVLLDLCTLCEAAVLLDQLAALEAADDHSFPLADRLEQVGLYRTFRPALSRDELRRLAFRYRTSLPAARFYPEPTPGHRTAAPACSSSPTTLPPVWTNS